MGLYMCNLLPPHSSTPPHSTSLSPSLSFLDEIQEQMAGVEDEAVVVKDLFDLIHQYQVPTPPEDLAVYQVQSACSLALRLHMENKSRAWEKGYSATCTRFRWISPGTSIRYRVHVASLSGFTWRIRVEPGKKDTVHIHVPASGGSHHLHLSDTECM